MTEQPPHDQPLSIPQRLAIVYERLDQLPAGQALGADLEKVRDLSATGQAARPGGQPGQERDDRAKGR